MSAVGAAMFGALAGGVLAAVLTVLAGGWISHRRVCDHCRDRRGWLIVERSWRELSAIGPSSHSPDSSQ